MSIDAAVDDLLSGGGAPVVKFPEIGTTIKGTVESAKSSQQTDMTTGKPKTWDNGEPMMQIVITLATDERDAGVEKDDGTRRVFVKGRMLGALRDALKEAGAKLETGGTLAIKYTGDDEPSRPGFNGAKLFKASYKAPVTSSLDADDLL